MSGAGSLDIFHNNSSLEVLNIRSNGQAQGYAGISFGVNKPAGRPKAAIFFQDTHDGAHFTGDLAFALNSTAGGATPVGLSDEKLRITKAGSVGIGTTAPRCIVDLKEGYSGINTFVILPQVSSTVGLGTTAGALMFNTSTSKFQGFTGAAWVDLH